MNACRVADQRRGARRTQQVHFAAPPTAPALGAKPRGLDRRSSSVVLGLLFSVPYASKVPLRTCPSNIQPAISPRFSCGNAIISCAERADLCAYSRSLVPRQSQIHRVFRGFLPMPPNKSPLESSRRCDFRSFSEQTPALCNSDSRETSHEESTSHRVTTTPWDLRPGAQNLKPET
jgi:hypothetical protein